MLPRRTRRTPPQLPAPGATSILTLCCLPSMCRSALIPVRYRDCPKCTMSGTPVLRHTSLVCSAVRCLSLAGSITMPRGAAVLLCQPCHLHRCWTEPRLVHLSVGTGRGAAAALPPCPWVSRVAPSWHRAYQELQGRHRVQPAGIRTGFKATHIQLCEHAWVKVRARLRWGRCGSADASSTTATAPAS